MDHTNWGMIESRSRQVTAKEFEVAVSNAHHNDFPLSSRSTDASEAARRGIQTALDFWGDGAPEVVTQPPGQSP